MYGATRPAKDNDQRASHIAQGFGLAVGARVALGVGLPYKKEIGDFLGRRLKSQLAGISESKAAYTKMVAGGEKIPAALAKTFGRNTFLMGGIGSAIGAAIGSQYDETGTGAVIGGLGGTVLAQSIRATGAYEKMGKIPGGRLLGVAALSGLLYNTIKRHQAPEVEETSYAERDNAGEGYHYSSSPVVEVNNTGLTERMARMNANGDLLFGLRQNRH